ncbi:hypothetical protein [Gluconobacter morbifer]|uniref:hypothetical protein n=1 Tax=Gluconobacter morbifer TaxID=479935 RepID=UPI0011118982|nr:hypothetical protein [Gluconobacter morbifer]
MSYKHKIWFLAKKPLLLLASIYFSTYANASERSCVDKNIENCDPINLMTDLGSDLPKRVENYSKIFGNDVSFYPINHASHHYDGEKITDGIAKVSQNTQFSNNIKLNFIELRIENPPYVSEVYFQFDNREKYNCLPASTIKDKFLNHYENIDENKFYYSYELNVMLKMSLDSRRGHLCVSNIDMRHIVKTKKITPQ